MRTPSRFAGLALSALALSACGGPKDAEAPKTAVAAPATPAATDSQAAETADATGDQRAKDAGKALIGARAPAIALTTVDGGQLDLAKLVGKKPVYLKFWATWCVPCREQMPHFEHAYEALGHDVAVVAVNTGLNETPEGVKAFRRKFGLKMPIVIDDGRLASALNLRVTPTHVLIDRSGRIAYVGHLADKPLDDALQGLRGDAATPGSARIAAPVPPAAQSAAIATDGRRLSFADPDGRRPTALVFFVPWCEPYLKDSQPDASAQCRSVREQADRLAAGGQVRLIGVASGLWTNRADVVDYQAKNRVAIPLALDASGDIFRAFRVTRSPTVVVLGPDGRETRRFTGAAVDGLARALAPASEKPA